MPTPNLIDAVEQLNHLRNQYLARLPAELADLTALAESLIENAVDSICLEELQHRLHKLSGSCGTFGLPKLGRTARNLELRVQTWLEKDHQEINDKAKRALADSIAALKIDYRPENLSLTRLTIEPTLTAGKIVRVWVIDDDGVFEHELKNQMESFNFEVHLFNEIEALKSSAGTSRPDIVIINIKLYCSGQPESINIEDKIILNSLTCPLLFLSPNDNFGLRVGAARLGAEGFFIKPVEITGLINRMIQILEKRRARPQRVLIVDDDIDLASHYRLVLNVAGMEAEILDNPKMVMAKIADFRPELILLDLHMPDCTGVDIAGVIRQYDEWSGLPIVYLSSESDLDIQIMAMGRGADDFLMKPIADGQLIAATRARIERARQLASLIARDSLTGLLKHAGIKEAADLETVRARRTGKPVTIAMLDIDNFKSVNDTYGHAVGDNVIASLAMLLRQRLRHSDIIGRYGGEEFAAVLPECDQADAYQLLDDIRTRFSKVYFSHLGDRFSCTISIGLADTTHFSHISGTELLAMADSALYKAKREGRNRSCIAKSIT